ncbi:hypothetical protein [Streptomyces mangrovisoli]|uniref:tRNA-guanine(15) transglycosylase-like domain-containing protein n=1 Tax=Streptomyces mangrovisoli TaxID=1428628 RepID=A0A1J4NNT2_9ACTN|nr:hypothetical protein [Streptomyces mangrovisoli]OIJ63260.1 hypothetical protein WN71_035145 [Streptomyces mangrovisoli]
MTDSSAPLPRPRSDLTEPPDAPQALAGALGVLQGRMLLHVSPARVGFLRAQLDAGRSGLVLCGPNALQQAKRLRETEAFSGPLLVDPGVYEVRAASEEDPFPDVSEGTFTFDDPLAVSLAEQRAAGVTAPLTPTGYLHAEDSDALKAAVRQVAALNDPQVVFAAPIDVGWLREEDSVRQLIAYLQLVKGPKALMLGGQMDPLARHPRAVGHLRQIVAQVPGTALLRTDLAAFGALAAGAVFTAFGAGSRLRHVIAPGEKAKTSKKGGGFASSPHVLFPELMDFFLGKTLADRFAGAPLPVCTCAACAGERALDSFADNAGDRQARAAAHNVAVLMEWLRTLTAVAPGTARQRWWHERCLAAVDRYPLLNAELKQPDGFKAPAQLKRWALAAPADEVAPARVDAKNYRRS